MTFDAHLIGHQLRDGHEWEGGGEFLAAFTWGVWDRRGRVRENTGGIGPTVAGDDPWAVAAECAAQARAMLARWRRAQEACRPYAPLFDGVKA